VVKCTLEENAPLNHPAPAPTHHDVLAALRRGNRDRVVLLLGDEQRALAALAEDVLEDLVRDDVELLLRLACRGARVRVGGWVGGWGGEG
jgi:hypothetical protein